jgi:hypothetical protein
MQFRTLKVIVAVDKTQLQPSRHPFFLFPQANQAGQMPTMSNICVLVRYYLGWAKSLE